MNITKEAKAKLEEAFVAHDCDCLNAELKPSCCGSSLVFNLAKLEQGDLYQRINGIPVLMEPEARERAETITISVEKEELVIQDENPSAGCC